MTVRYSGILFRFQALNNPTVALSFPGMFNYCGIDSAAFANSYKRRHFEWTNAVLTYFPNQNLSLNLTNINSHYFALNNRL